MPFLKFGSDRQQKQDSSSPDEICWEIRKSEVVVMNQQNSSGSFLPFAAIFTLAISFGMTWFTISGGHHDFSGGHNSVAPSFATSMNITANAINGSISLGPVDLPIWLIITLGIVGILLTLPRIQQASSAPKGVPIALLGVAAVASLTTFAISEIQVSSGPFFAVAGAAMGLVHAFRPVNPVPTEQNA